MAHPECDDPEDQANYQDQPEDLDPWDAHLRDREQHDREQGLGPDPDQQAQDTGLAQELEDASRWPLLTYAPPAPGPVPLPRPHPNGGLPMPVSAKAVADERAQKREAAARAVAGAAARAVAGAAASRTDQEPGDPQAGDPQAGDPRGVGWNPNPRACSDEQGSQGHQQHTQDRSFDYPYTNDAYFGTSDELPPVPVDPPRPPRQAAPGQVADPPYDPPPPYRSPAAAGGGTSRSFVYRPGPERDDVTPLELGLDESDQGGSVGTGIQMLAQGPQNYMLDIHAHMSFFTAVYRRHTAFAMECFEDEVTLAFGRPVTVELVRRADMLGDVFLEVALPDLGIPGGRWVDAVGYVLLSRVRLVMGDVVLHDQERLWYDLVDRVFMPHGKRRAVDAMIGRGRVLATDAAHTVHVPFKFLCCKNHYANQQFLPLASLSPNVKLTVEITTEGLEGLVHLPPGAAPPPTLTTLAAKVLSEQAFVDPDEKRAAMHHPARLMIESFQDVDALSYTFDDAGTYDLKSVSLDLRELNLPVKTLLLVAYDDNATQSKRYFDYLDCVDRAVLLIASAERFPPRAGEYFSLVQTYQHSSACAPDNVHMYSFALDASQRQPSGTLNFAPLANPTLRVDLKNTGGRAVKVKAFAQCLNWLTVQSGSMDYLFNA